MTDGGITWKRHLEAEFYEETEEAKGPRGLAEAAVKHVRFEAGPQDDLLALTIDGHENRYFVPRDVLKSALKVKD